MVQPGLTATGTSALLMLLGLAMVGPLFAQSAWNNVTFTGSEIRDPGRNLPRALLIGCLAVVALYLLANIAYIVTLPLATIQKPPNSVATATMQAVFSRPGTILMACGNHDLDVRLQQRLDSGGRARLLRHGARQSVLSACGLLNRQPRSCSGAESCRESGPRF